MERIMNVTQARKDIYKIASHVNENHEEVVILNAATGNNMVVLSESDWNAVKETLYLNSIPGMTESILAAAKEPIEDGTAYIGDEPW